MLAQIAYKLGGEKVRHMALAVMVWNPLIIFFIPILTNQHISQFFLMLGIWVFICSSMKNQYIRSLIAGLCIGMGHLMRPDLTPVILAVAVYVVYIIIRDKQIVKPLVSFAIAMCSVAAVIVAANALLISPGIVKNNIWEGNLDYKIMLGLNPETHGIWNKPDSLLAGNKEKIHEVLEQRLENPVKLIPLMYGKSAYQYGIYYYPWSFRPESPWVSNNILRRAGLSLMIITCAIASYRMIFTRRRNLYWAYMILAVYMCVYALIEIQARYNFVFIPFIVLVACVGSENDAKIKGKLKSIYNLKRKNNLYE